ncbi:MAG: FAD-dependent monooxygenase [Fidelibacterota bacterium]
MSRSVSIIGGSAAGFLTGALLARRGFEVQIFESADRFDPTRRTLIVTNRLKELLGQDCNGAVLNEIHEFELFADSMVSSIKLDKPDLIIDRSILIQGLANETDKLGVKTMLGHRFVNVETNGKGLQLVVEEGTRRKSILTDIVVGADGAFSKVRRAGGWPQQATVPIMQAIVSLPEGMSSSTSRIWFVPEDTPYFYWLIPESERKAAIGVIGEDGRKMRSRMVHFLESHSFTPIEFQAARIPCYTQWMPISRRMGDGTIYLVGDAAGHVKVSTVGGIVTGLQGAFGVAEAISNGGSASELTHLRHELDLHLLIRKVLHGWQQDDYVRLLRVLNKKTHHVLGSVTRDEAYRLLRRLLLKQPKLLLLGIRSLISASRFPNDYLQRENHRNKD